jgi:hypothetical protein
MEMYCVSMHAEAQCSTPYMKTQKLDTFVCLALQTLSIPRVINEVVGSGLSLIGY